MRVGAAPKPSGTLAEALKGDVIVFYDYIEGSHCSSTHLFRQEESLIAA